ncbi:MAG: precorrin-8X methylmutase [Halobacteriota archaeon]
MSIKKPENSDSRSTFGALTEEARRISERSQEIVRDIVGDESPEGKLKQRVVMATGDPAFKDLLRFTNNPINSGIDAIKRGAPIYTDIMMVKVGISREAAAFGSEVVCWLAQDEVGLEQNLTRASTGFRKLGEKLAGSIVVIGNAPSAALTLADMVDERIVPVLIIATPVGFVNAAESKEHIRRLAIPSITTVGTRGGTPVAVALVNELITIAKL